MVSLFSFPINPIRTELFFELDGLGEPSKPAVS